MTSVLRLLDLTGRTALVTGGGIGLGKQLALALAEAGADVAVGGRRVALCEQTAAEIRALGRRALAFPLDVRQETQVRETVARTIEGFGLLDILVCNSGTNRRHPLVSQPLAEWEEVLETNLMGTVWACQAAGPHMIERRRGRIVVIGSVYGSHGRDGRLYVEPGQEPVESLPYSASKGALLNFTRDLAAAWGRHGITVNAISPGMFGQLDAEGRRTGYINETAFCDRTPLGRWGEADDVKGAIVYLASDAAAFVTGHNLVVDGGWTIW